MTRLEMFEKMLLVRRLEERLQRYCDEGRAGDLHFNKGQEAIAVGVSAAMTETDRMVTHHRTIAHQIARGAKLYPLVAELLGKRTGTNGGRAGEMHINDKKIGHDFSFQIVGTCITVGAGLAWAVKNKWRTRDVVVVFFGDAASSNGQFHEGLSLAAIHSLPILFVCENNGLAGNITPKHYMPTGAVYERVEGYKIDTWSGDGNDVEEVRELARDCISAIRSDCRPRFLELETTRLCWHKQGQRDVRPKEVLDELAKRDPIKRLLAESDFKEEVSTEKIDHMLDETFARVEADLPPAEIPIDE